MSPCSSPLCLVELCVLVLCSVIKKLFSTCDSELPLVPNAFEFEGVGARVHYPFNSHTVCLYYLCSGRKVLSKQNIV